MTKKKTKKEKDKDFALTFTGRVTVLVEIEQSNTPMMITVDDLEIAKAVVRAIYVDDVGTMNVDSFTDFEGKIAKAVLNMKPIP